MSNICFTNFASIPFTQSSETKAWNKKKEHMQYYLKNSHKGS